MNIWDCLCRGWKDRAPGAQNPDFTPNFRSAEGFSIQFQSSAKVFGAQFKKFNTFCTPIWKDSHIDELRKRSKLNPKYLEIMPLLLKVNPIELWIDTPMIGKAPFFCIRLFDAKNILHWFLEGAKKVAISGAHSFFKDGAMEYWQFFFSQVSRARPQYF